MSHRRDLDPAATWQFHLHTFRIRDETLKRKSAEKNRFEQLVIGTGLMGTDLSWEQTIPDRGAYKILFLSLW